MKLLLNTMLFRLTQQMREVQRPFMNQLGMTHGQPRIIRYAAEHPGCMQAEMAKYYHIKPSTVSQIVDDLAAGGFLERCTSEGCRRRASISLTEKGRKCSEELSRMHICLQERMLKGFTAEEEAQFRSFIERATENLKEDEDEAADQVVQIR